MRALRVNDTVLDILLDPSMLILGSNAAQLRHLARTASLMQGSHSVGLDAMLLILAMAPSRHSCSDWLGSTSLQINSQLPENWERVLDLGAFAVHALQDVADIRHREHGVYCWLLTCSCLARYTVAQCCPHQRLLDSCTWSDAPLAAL